MDESSSKRNLKFLRKCKCKKSTQKEKLFRLQTFDSENIFNLVNCDHMSVLTSNVKKYLVFICTPSFTLIGSDKSLNIGIWLTNF